MKFVYFDIGGVLLKDLSDVSDGWEILLKKLNLKNNQKQKFNDFFKNFEKELDLGKWVKEFPMIMKSEFNINLPEKYSVVNELVNNFFVRNEGIWKIVEDIETKYKVGLLTNMYEGMLDLIKKKKLIPDINWDVIVDSSIEKCRKPDKEIYEIAQKRGGVEGKEILFIDNKQENLKIPQKMGWQTYWYDSNDYQKSNWKLEQYLG
jgi:epoxide hydrolase-like predicted phosphatase